MPAAPSVADLVRTARSTRVPLQRQQEAFAELVRRFERTTFAAAVDATSDMDVARDVCQEAFLDAWRRLASLREPAAFGAWLLRLVRTHATRWRRGRKRLLPADDLLAAIADESHTGDPERALDRADVQRLIWQAVEALPAAQRRTVELFYFLGEPMRVIARITSVPTGTVGKRLHAARIRMRRALPRGVAAAFLKAPTAAFTRQVQGGLLAEFEGEYRFPSRPKFPVVIRRENGFLVAYGGGQRNVLASSEPDVLHASEFDGDARFRRDRRGRITHFVYFEFGQRLGVARKLTSRRK